jgi:hypothetical protein
MKDRVIFKTGEFTDFNGLVRQVIFCAISTECEVLIDSWDEPFAEHVNKKLLLGVAVQNANDVPNIELGKIIAEGKARKQKSRVGTIFSTTKGMINSKVVEALLEQELDHFKQSPQSYIRGYAKALEKNL